MIGHIRCAPRRFARGHLNDGAAQGPDVTGAAITVTSEYLRRHEGDGALELALELARNCRLGHHPRRCSEVSDSQVMTRGVNQ